MPAYLGLASQLIDPSGTYYMRARWYEPITGRFLTRDPLGGDAGEPSTLNSFAYAGGDPVGMHDPSGLDFEPVLDPGGICLSCGVEPGSDKEGPPCEKFGQGGCNLNTLTNPNATGGRTTLVPVRTPSGLSILASGQDGSPAPAASGGGRGPTRGGDSPAARLGRLMHQAFADLVRAKGWRSEELLRGADGNNYRPDAVTRTGHIIELKPNTASGRKQGALQIAIYMEQLGKKGRVMYYDP
jgi:RHS repeat-associated protein